MRDLDRERFGQVMIDDHVQSDRSGALRLEFFGRRIDQKVLVPDPWMERFGLVSSDDPVDWILDFRIGGLAFGMAGQVRAQIVRGDCGDFRASSTAKLEDPGRILDR